MLIIRYYLEMWNSLSTETKYDIQQAMSKLTFVQFAVVTMYIYGYTLAEIETMFLKQGHTINAQEYLVAAMIYIQAYTGYSDYAVLQTAKGVVKKKWIAQCNQIAVTF